MSDFFLYINKLVINNRLPHTIPTKKMYTGIIIAHNFEKNSFLNATVKQEKEK